MKITLVRHTSVAAEAGVCYGQTDVEVAQTFEQEAAIVQSKLATMEFDSLFSSPLKRCIKLANFCDLSTLCIDDRLQEMDFGAWEMMRWEAIDDPQLAIWYRDWINERPTNGESFVELINRVKSFLQELIQSDAKNVLIFTHAGVIRAFIILIEQLHPEDAFKITLDFGQIVNLNLTSR